MLRVRAFVEYLVEVDADFGIGAHQLAEVLVFFPGAHRVALHEPVRLIALESRLDECEEQPLREIEAVARVEIAAHSLRPHDQPFHEPREPVEHVVQGEERVWNDDPLRGRMRDVALVPEGDVLEPDDRGRANDPCQSAYALCDNGIPLVRHRRRALLTFAERLLELADLGAREVADLERELVERRRGDGECGEQLGVTVTLQDLRGGRSGLEAQALARYTLHLRVDRCVLADGSRQLADA